MTYKRVAIIGGGPSGLAIAKALAFEPYQFEAIDVFERRDRVGGVWNYDGDKSHLRPPVPSLDPGGRDYNDNIELTPAAYASPMYKYLETNIPSKIMEYEQVFFDSDGTTFPARESVLDYVKKYATTIPSDKVYIHLNSAVTSVTKLDSVWHIEFRSTIAPYQQNKEQYDAVVIANGHFEVPFIPEVKGLQNWNDKAPGSITHAKYYIDPEPYRDKNVLIIGNFSSGQDISTQVLVTAKSVYVSIKDTDEASKLDASGLIKYIGVVEEYNYDQERSVKTVDNEVVKDIDVVIFCTGYLYSVPFLNTYKEDVLSADGNQIQNLYKHIFYTKDPSLSFVGLPKNVIPMPLAESQGAVIARVYSGRLSLPSEIERSLAYEQELKERGSGKSFHSLAYPLDITYYKDLQQLVDQHKTGFNPPLWDDERVQLRADTSTLKKARVANVVKYAIKLRNERADSFKLLD
ncbi:uncharacterized protein RJT21DRAFT_130504 [Scheffersomyces amazonensis]|uniref:uncharacterized protein n=1 Tax=Scheffersomyces amazonensis TaxID=1078765 RepID=UPI00315D47EF